MEAEMKTMLRIVFVFGCLQLCQAPVQAETYPARPISIVVGYPPGGAVDVVTRAVAQRLSANLGQPVIVENKPGASTQIGAETVAKAAPDGYTLLATDGTTFTNQFLYHKLPYRPDRDFLPVSGLGTLNQLLVVHPSFPAHSVTDLIALAKAKPGALNYATLGIGSSDHLATQMLEDMAGIDMTPVHYKGGAPALTDVLAGQVPIIFLSATLTAQSIQAGKLRALATAAGQRLARFPELPTVAETIPGFEATVWQGLFAPRATPHDIVTKLNTEVQKILADPAFRDRFLDPNFYEPVIGSADAFARFIAEDEQRWGKVIASAKLSLD
jgi:tripartite-type tricarboxylate transporter receptor subunit TctC